MNIRMLVILYKGLSTFEWNLQEIFHQNDCYMIIIANRISKLDLSKLKALYADDIENLRKQYYRKLLEQEGTLLAEQDFIRDLQDSFFAQEESKLFVYEQDSAYLAAVRIEHFEDGLLLSSLVTAHHMRRKGIAEKLLSYAFEQLPEVCVYSHVHYRNIPSIKLHEKLGFYRRCDYAHMLDGSIRTDHFTYVYDLIK